MSQSLDSTAIAQIQQMAFNKAVEQSLSDSDCPAIAVPAGVSIEDIEYLQNGRFRFRGVMRTGHIEDFVRYSTGYSEVGSRCFIDAAEMSAVSVFNLGTIAEPGHADNTAALKLVKTAPFSALLDIDGRKSAQKILAEWIEDWGDFLTGFDAEGQVIPAKKAAGAIRKITLEAVKSSDYEEGDFNAKRSVMESVEAKTKDIMPVAFEFKCFPYEGLEERALSLRLSILASDQPILVLRIVQLEAVKEAIATEFRDLLITKFTDSDIETFIGSFKA